MIGRILLGTATFAGVAAIATFLSASALFAQPTPPAASQQPPAHPPMPTYQMRPPENYTADRLAGQKDGQALFRLRCGACHLPGGMGTNLLTRINGPEQALLEEREGLTVEYVEMIARQGRAAMPRLSKVEVTDPELRAIATYLSRNTK